MPRPALSTTGPTVHLTRKQLQRLQPQTFQILGGEHIQGTKHYLVMMSLIFIYFFLPDYIYILITLYIITYIYIYIYVNVVMIFSLKPNIIRERTELVGKSYITITKVLLLFYVGLNILVQVKYLIPWKHSNNVRTLILHWISYQLNRYFKSKSKLNNNLVLAYYKNIYDQRLLSLKPRFRSKLSAFINDIRVACMSFVG